MTTHLPWTGLNWASDQTETSEKRHATVTTIRGMGRSGRLPGEHGLLDAGSCIMASLLLSLSYVSCWNIKWSLVRAVGGPRYICARAHGSCQQQCHNSLTHMLAAAGWTGRGSQLIWYGGLFFFIVLSCRRILRGPYLVAGQYVCGDGLGCVSAEDSEWLYGSGPSRLFLVIPCHHCILVILAVVKVCSCQMDG